MAEFSHIDSNGNALMVDVTDKNITLRTAKATGSITLSKEAYDMVKQRRMKKGDVLGVAQVAGIMATKRTADLIPLCHILNLTKSSLEFEFCDETCQIIAFCTAKCDGKTGVEMEALTGVSVGLLTIYDMCKAVDKNMVISGVYLLSKQGGKSGDFVFKGDI